jgi:hypothetical protein
MSSKSNREHKGFLPAQSLNVAQNSNMAIPHSLNETTNQLPRSPGSKAKQGNVLSHLAMPAIRSQTCGHTNRKQNRELRRAILKDDWRKRYPGDTEKVLSGGRTLSNYSRASDSNETSKYRKTQLHTKTALEVDTGWPCYLQDQKKSHNNPDLIETISGNRVESNPAGDGGEDGDDHHQSPPCRPGITQSSVSMFLGEKHFYTLENLLSPALSMAFDKDPSDDTERRPEGTTQSGIEHSNNFGIVTVSKNISHLLSERPSVEAMKPTVQIQEARDIYGLQQRKWDSLSHFCYLTNKSSGRLKGCGDLSLTTDWARTLPQRILSSQAQNEMSKNVSSLKDLHSHKSPKTYVEPLDKSQDENQRYLGMLSKLNHKAALERQTRGLSSFSIQDWRTPMEETADDFILDKASEEHHNVTSSVTSRHNEVPRNVYTLNPTAAEFSITTQNPLGPTTCHLGGPIKSVEDLVPRPSTVPKTATLSNMNDHASQHFGNPYGPGQPGNGYVSEVDRLFQLTNYIQRIVRLTGKPPTDADVRALVKAMRIGSAEVDLVPGVKMPAVAASEQGCVLPSDILRIEDLLACDVDAGALNFPASCFPPHRIRHIKSPCGLNMHSASHVNTTISRASPKYRIADLPPHTTNTIFRKAPNVQGILSAIGTENLTSHLTHHSASAARNLGQSNVLFTESDNINPLPPAIIGPKPVTRPKGPPRPNDPAWNKKQQEYEAYLEHQRTLNPDFHQECRDRQAKRADRKKREEIKCQFKIPDKKSAAVAIKKPVELS